MKNAPEDPGKTERTPNSSPYDELVTDVRDIADTLAKEVADKSSSDNYNQNFKNHMKAEKTKLNFSSNNRDYNQRFSKAELDSAISES